MRDKETTGSLSSFFDEVEEEEIDEGLPPNIINLFDDWTNKVTIDDHVWLEEKIRRLDLKFDAGVIFIGPTPAVGIPNVGIERLDGKGKAKTLEMFQKYYAGIVHTLNWTNTPFISICSDPKYAPQYARDIINDERVVLSQINQTYARKRIKSYEESLTLRDVKLKYIYSGIETVFLLGEKKIEWLDRPKTNKFVIGLNGGLSRDEFIKDWILKGDTTGIKVYGEWADEFTTGWPDVFENKSIRSVEDVFLNSRYTIIAPPHKPTGNFVTQKFWKMIYYGIIPFFHPNYDTDNIFNVPAILRVKTPKDMWERIKFLDENPETYKLVQKRLYDMLDDSYFNGDFLYNVVKTNLEQYTGVVL
jgi:hypothetical protein